MLCPNLLVSQFYFREILPEFFESQMQNVCLSNNSIYHNSTTTQTTLQFQIVKQKMLSMLYRVWAKNLDIFNLKYRQL